MCFTRKKIALLYHKSAQTRKLDVLSQHTVSCDPVLQSAYFHPWQKYNSYSTETLVQDEQLLLIIIAAFFLAVLLREM